MFASAFGFTFAPSFASASAKACAHASLTLQKDALCVASFIFALAILRISILGIIRISLLVVVPAIISVLLTLVLLVPKRIPRWSDCCI